MLRQSAALFRRPRVGWLVGMEQDRVARREPGWGCGSRGGEHANSWGKSGCPCHDLLALGGTEARVAMPEGILERVVQNRRADIQEGLHRRPVPAHLLRLTWGVSLSRVRSSANADGRWRAVGPAPRQRAKGGARRRWHPYRMRGRAAPSIPAAAQ